MEGIHSRHDHVLNYIDAQLIVFVPNFGLGLLRRDDFLASLLSCSLVT